MIKIALVDDEKLLKTMLYPYINSFENCQVILEALNGKEFIEKLAANSLPDLVFLDLSMPIMDGFETAEWLSQHYPEKIRVVVLTSLDSDVALIRLIRMGVRGFIKKSDISATELKGAIKTIMQEGYYYNGSNFIYLLKNMDSKTPMVNGRTLTEVEMKFLRLACSSKTYRAIALEMQVSPRTVDGYRESLFGKLRVDSRVELALFAVKHGFVRL